MQSAILCAADLFRAFGDSILAMADIGGAKSPGSSLVAQLLAKASLSDKRFVIEEAQQTLAVMCEEVKCPDLWHLHKVDSLEH